MHRVVVVGAPGSGKTTLARVLAERLQVPHLELDAEHHLPGWQECPLDRFRERVAERVEDGGWVVDGNYLQRCQDIVWPRADTVVWLDLPRWVVMGALVRRTLSRGVLRRPLWNGNRERALQIIDPRPEHNIVLFAYGRFEHYRERYGAVMRDPRWSHLRFVRLRRRLQVRKFRSSAP